MKALVSIFAVMLFCSGSMAAMDPNSKELDKLFDVLNMKQTTDDVIRKMVEMQIQQNPSLKPIEADFLGFMRKSMSWDVIEKDIRVLYAERFTEQEVQELAAFYRTPVGKKAIMLMPELAAEGAKMGQERAKKNLPEFLESIKQKMKSGAPKKSIGI